MNFPQRYSGGFVCGSQQQVVISHAMYDSV